MGVQQNAVHQGPAMDQAGLWGPAMQECIHAAGGLQRELPGMILQLQAKPQSKDTGVRDDGAQMSTMRDDWIWGNWWAVRLSGPWSRTQGESWGTGQEEEVIRWDKEPG